MFSGESKRNIEKERGKGFYLPPVHCENNNYKKSLIAIAHVDYHTQNSCGIHSNMVIINASSPSLTVALEILCGGG